MSSIEKNLWKYINGEPTSFSNSDGVPSCTDISAACTNQSDAAVLANFGWDKFPGNWKNIPGKKPDDAYFLRIKTWTNPDHVFKIGQMIKEIGQGIVQSDTGTSPGEGIVFDDKGNFYRQGDFSSEGLDYDEFLNPMLSKKTKLDSTNDFPLKYIRKFNKIGITANASSSIKRWFVRNENILFNRNLTYFIRVIYGAGGREGYGLYYNPIHRGSFSDLSYLANGEDDNAKSVFNKTISNYCDATTDALNPAADINDNRWGDPTCGCSKRIEVESGDYDFTKNEQSNFSRYFNDAFSDLNSTRPSWPYGTLSDQKNFDQLKTFITSNEKDWGPLSSCYSPACKFFTDVESTTSYIPAYVASKSAADACNDTTKNVTIENCNIGLDFAGDADLDGNVLSCNGGGDKGNCPAGQFNDTSTSTGDDVVTLNCMNCPKDTYSVGNSPLPTCTNCPDGTGTNGLTGQITCSKNDPAIDWTEIILLVILVLVILGTIAGILYIFKDDIVTESIVTKNIVTPTQSA